MKIIVISSPSPVSNEAFIFQKLIESGVDYIHIRKPGDALSIVRNLLINLPSVFHSKIKLHYYIELIKEFPLVGFHHSGASSFDRSIEKKQSKSFHSFEEVEQNTFPYEYFFLSPVFSSISKVNYQPNYSIDEFQSFLEFYQNKSCIALGGVSEANVKQLKEIGFSGVALLGTLWAEKDSDIIIEKFVRIYRLIKN